ncbi:MAG: hypothetical protein DHS20C08_15800 [Rhodomicrobium sp.]|nr:MAG: hypothetical protein DHS20C08_15800 [Rhodomicrobium sp.]
MIEIAKKFTECASSLPDWLYTTIARFAVGFTFLLSGLTKVDENYMVQSKTFALFEDIYFAKLPLPDALLTPLTYIATYSELILPLLLFVGLFSRFAALGLLIMTLVIQFIVFPDQILTYKEHGLWAVALLAILIRGPGPFSLDYILGRAVR